MKNIIKYYPRYRIADAFSKLTRGSFLQKEIKQKKLYDKLNPANDRKINDKITLFIADLIDQIILHYIDKSQSDVIQWFLDNFVSQGKRLEDIIDYDSITLQQCLNHNKKQPISNVQSYINQNGSCISVLVALSKFKKINKQLHKDDQVKLNKLNYTNLIQFVYYNEKNKQLINDSGEPKTLSKVHVPNIHSYKVYKCYPPKNNAQWRQDPSFIQLNSKYAKDAKWCVIQGKGIPYGRYLNSKWNFYVLVTTKSNQPVMLFNFSQDYDGQIKDIHDNAFSSYNEQLFTIIDWFVKQYDFDPSKAPDYSVYLKLKEIYNTSLDTEKYKLVFSDNKYRYYEDIHYYYVIDNNNVCKFFVVNNHYNGNIIRPGNKKEKINVQLIDFLIKFSCNSVLRNLIQKKIIQKQNGEVYIKAMKYLLKAQKSSFLNIYLENGVIDNNIMSFQQAVVLLNNSKKITNLLLQNKIHVQNIQFCLNYILNKKEYGEYAKILNEPSLKNQSYDYIDQDINHINNNIGIFTYDDNFHSLFVDLNKKQFISEFSYIENNIYKIYNKQYLKEQAQFFVENNIKFPLFLLKQQDEVSLDQQLMLKISEVLDEQFYDDIQQSLINGQLDDESTNNILQYYIQTNNNNKIEYFLENYSGDSFDNQDLYDYIASSKNAKMKYLFLDNYHLLYSVDFVDRSYQIINQLIRQIADEDISYLELLDMQDNQIANNVFYIYVQKRDYSKALNAIDYLHDSYQKSQLLSTYINNICNENNTEYLVHFMDNYGKNIDDDFFDNDDSYDLLIKTLVDKNIAFDGFEKFQQSFQNKIIDYIIKNSKTQILKQLTNDVLDILNNADLTAIFELLISQEEVEIIKTFDLDYIPDTLYDDLIELFIQKKELQYIVPLNSSYPQIKQLIYQFKNYNDLFELGKMEKLDNNKIDFSVTQILWRYINDKIIKSKKSVEILFSDLKDFVKLNIPDDQKMSLNIIEKILKNNYNVSQLQIGKLLLVCTNLKIVDQSEQLFELLIKYEKYLLIMKIFKNDNNKLNKVKQIIKNNLDYSKIDLKTIKFSNLTQACMFLNQDKIYQYINLYNSIISVSDKKFLIDNFFDIALNSCIDGKILYQSKQDVTKIICGLIDKKYPKNKCKQFFEKYETLLYGKKIYDILLQNKGYQLDAKETQKVIKFKNLIEDANIKMSSKILNLYEILS